MTCPFFHTVLCTALPQQSKYGREHDTRLFPVHLLGVHCSALYWLHSGGACIGFRRDSCLSESVLWTSYCVSGQCSMAPHNDSQASRLSAAAIMGRKCGTSLRHRVVRVVTIACLRYCFSQKKMKAENLSSAAIVAFKNSYMALVSNRCYGLLALVVCLASLASHTCSTRGHESQACLFCPVSSTVSCRAGKLGQMVSSSE